MDTVGDSYRYIQLALAIDAIDESIAINVTDAITDSSD